MGDEWGILVLSLSYRMRSRWRTFVPTTDHFWVCYNSPNTPLSNFLQVSTNDYMRRTFVPTTIHPAQLFLFFRDPITNGLSLFLSVLLRTHATDRHTNDGLSCMTVLMVRDPFPKGLHIFILSLLWRTPATDRRIYDDPSCIYRHTCQRLSFRVLHIKNYK